MVPFRALGDEVLEEQKFQITNFKYQTNNNDQNCPRSAWTPHPAGWTPVSKFQTCFGHLVLEFEICL
jgi:hypothetical protein